MSLTHETLLRRLTQRDAIALVVGTVIGTGIFLKTAVMAQQTGSAAFVLLAWFVAGLLSLAGALTYAELGGLFPKAGGEYVYLRESFGDFFAFLYGWMRFWIASPGSIAAYAVGSVAFLNGVLHFEDSWSKNILALSIIAVFSAINCMSVMVSGRLQSFMTAIKALSTLFLAFALILFSTTGTWSNLNGTNEMTFSWTGFGAAVLAALWAFDGWNNLPMAAGEVHDAQKVVPRALIIGIFSVFALYALANIAYFYALPFADVLTSSSSQHPDALPVATNAAATVFGATGVIIISLMTAFSALGALNGSILTAARVPYAMARDGLFPTWLGEVSHKTRVPVLAVIVQGVWSCVLALSGSFDQLTDYVVFASWIFYGMCAVGLFILRRKLAHEHRPFETPLYPWLPALFLFATVVLLINTLYSSPRESGIGLLLIALGLPIYWWKHAKSRHRKS